MRKKIEQHKTFASKWSYLLMGAGGGWSICWFYVTKYGTFPQGQFMAFLSESWLFLSPILIPVIITIATTYFTKRMRRGDD